MRHMVRAALQVQARPFQRTSAFRTSTNRESTFGNIRVVLQKDWKLIFRAPMGRKPAVELVFHHIGPYHHSRLNAAAAKLSVTEIEWSRKAYDA